MASPQMRMRSETPEPMAKRRPALRLLGSRAQRGDFSRPAGGDRRPGPPSRSGRAGQLRDLRNHSCCLAELLQTFLQRFHRSLYAMENTLVRVLHRFEPELVRGSGKRGPDLYYHPLIYRNKTACWEAERAASGQTASP